jgi:hypothetical protein
MKKKERLESAAGKIRNQLHADPQDWMHMAEARLLADGLGDSNSQMRGEIRERLRAFGKAALPAFLSALTDSNSYMRWEAAKALSETHYPETAPDLVNALEDSDFGVRWLAAEGLISMGPVCLETLLQGLRLNFESIRMREGVQHVLHALVDSGFREKAMENLLHVLQKTSPTEEIAWAVEQAWEEIRSK